MNKTLSILAVVISLTALVATIVRNGKMPVSPGDNAASRNAVLEQRFKHLEDTYQVLEMSYRRLRDSFDESSGKEARVGVGHFGELEMKLNDLIEQQTELEDFTRDLDKLGIIKSIEGEVQKAYDILMDESLPVWTRAKQAEKLKRYGQFDDAAVESMMNLWGQTKNNNEKAGILSALTGIVDTDLRDQILVTLNDELQNGKQSPKFRYQAIEALEPMLPDPTVEEWLNYLAENDPEPKLQARAGRPSNSSK